ncbi:hypothetical protein [uncultured Alteromonas sp.]|uniref:hypothetical protein n=1 Tax=uncultured Alteromonas sp. TaxID=179113 RepID=UPI0030CD93C3|tara:strand:+ start:45147 stop:46292 length:1146 start_codon:yes stop_codon:yes gene_type:complete
MLHAETTKIADRVNNSEPSALNTPLQYAGRNLSIKTAINHAANRLEETRLAIASTALNDVISNYAEQALPIGLSVSRFKQYGALSPSERSRQYPKIMTALHTDFNDLLESETSICDSRVWDVYFNSGVPKLGLSDFFGFGHLKEDTENLLLRGFISAFSNILAEDFGALTNDDVIEYAFGSWGDYTEVKCTKTFIAQYANIIGDLEQRENEDEDETVAYINQKYATALKIFEYFGKQQIEACYASLQRKISEKTHYKNTHELLPIVEQTIEMWQLWDDPDAIKLLTDIRYYQTHLEGHVIASLSATDESDMWQHLILISDWEANIPANTYEAADSTCNDTFNNGGEMYYDINISNPNWLDDLNYFEKFSGLLQSYFDIYWQ